MDNMDKLSTIVKHEFSDTRILNCDSENFSKKDVLKQLNTADGIYLFAGHSYANSKNVIESFINMTVYAPDENYHKFKLTMPDILNTNWQHANLIFLLGCETGSGNLYRGIGVSGLQTSFLLSGANNVLASLWRIDAKHSIHQASDFLKEYKKTGNSLEALRYTQINAIDHLKSNSYFIKPHPYFWGSYILAQKNIN
jgi:CHAT domain-containing protein